MAHLSAISHLAQTRLGNKPASGDIKHAVPEERAMLRCNPSAGSGGTGPETAISSLGNLDVRASTLVCPSPRSSAKLVPQKNNRRWKRPAPSPENSRVR
jgi:hypothetical protein